MTLAPTPTASRRHTSSAIVTACALAMLASASTQRTGSLLAQDGATVTRGPYLQRGSSSSIVVRWRTSTAVVGRVEYGLAAGDATWAAEEPAAATDHVVEITGLLPDTRYYYAVGTESGRLAGGDASHTFRTAPRAGTARSTRVWVLGDSGTADANARAVRDAYYRFAGSRATDLWLMLGDNAYETGTDAEYQAAVFAMYPSMLRSSVLWPTLGNHDGYSADSASQSGPYYRIFTLPTRGEAGGLASGTEAYYSFDYGNIHFVCLDSFETSRSPTGAMLTWLRNDLAATTQPWIVAFFHHPPYSKGSHDSDTEVELVQMREHALPILEDAGVDLVLSGHSHSYERSYLIDGHYGGSSTFTSAMKKHAGSGREDQGGAYTKPDGTAPHAGAVYAVAGSSGQATGGRLNHPAMFVSLNSLGSLVLDVNGDRLDASFLDHTGVRRDYFTIRKGQAGASGPYGGAARDLPGTVQAEDFDTGGAGVAYVDTTSGNTGGQYRTGDVDIQATSDAGGGHNIGWIRAGEWLHYSVDVGTAGTYTLSARVAASGTGGIFHVAFGGADKTGAIGVPNTGGWQTWTTVTKTVTLAAGPQVMRIAFDANGTSGGVANLNWVRLEPAATTSRPWGGTPRALPGTVQAEDFDTGGNRVSYLDTTSGNAGGQYRNTAVDIERTLDTGGGYNLGWIVPGEWLNYAVTVASSGTYTFRARVAVGSSGGTFHVEFNGVDKTGPITIPSTGGWQRWTTVSKAISLAPGQQTMRIVFDRAGTTGAVGNVNWVAVTAP